MKKNSLTEEDKIFIDELSFELSKTPTSDKIAAGLGALFIIIMFGLIGLFIVILFMLIPKANNREFKEFKILLSKAILLGVDKNTLLDAKKSYVPIYYIKKQIKFKEEEN